MVLMKIFGDKETQMDEEEVYFKALCKLIDICNYFLFFFTALIIAVFGLLIKVIFF